MTVETTTERVLRLLALLQRRPSWTATELAAELGVTDRSVRRDVERLRATLPVLVAEDPLTCVVRGSGMALERMDKLGSIFSYE